MYKVFKLNRSYLSFCVYKPIKSDRTYFKRNNIEMDANLVIGSWVGVNLRVNDPDDFPF